MAVHFLRSPRVTHEELLRMLLAFASVQLTGVLCLTLATSEVAKSVKLLARGYGGLMAGLLSGQWILALVVVLTIIIVVALVWKYLTGQVRGFWLGVIALIWAADGLIWVSHSSS